ncbi:MAG: hypothetical protein IBX55_00245 [Methyloprofundus sp.]|nr:hypothetical protein [Methyloprofundus sp.]
MLEIKNKMQKDVLIGMSYLKMIFENPALFGNEDEEALCLNQASERLMEKSDNLVLNPLKKALDHIATWYKQEEISTDFPDMISRYYDTYYITLLGDEEEEIAKYKAFLKVRAQKREEDRLKSIPSKEEVIKQVLAGIKDRKTRPQTSETFPFKPHQDRQK